MSPACFTMRGPRPGSSAEVVPRARRRTFTNADKRRILLAADP